MGGVMNILLLNAESSSLKASLVDASDGRTLASGLADWAGAKTRYLYSGPDGNEQSAEVPWKGHAPAVQNVLADIEVKPAALADRAALSAVEHRIVHDGEFTSSVRITKEIRTRLAALANLAPLHNPPSLE